ncbi:alginate lyase family protein [candidate division KSB1 bacterium]|nr:alginate lyase family protein [candidate division KSB1 bacterium]
MRMSKSLRAKIIRLRAMNLPEIFYRIFIAVRDKLATVRRQQRGTESLQLLVSGMGCAVPPLEKKFSLYNKKIFAWQRSGEANFKRLYDSYFSEHRLSTIAAAERATRREFNLFGQSLLFSEAIDWHYDPLQQKSIPLSDRRRINYYSGDTVREVKYVWELNRCQHFVTLGKAFFLTGDATYAEALCRQWRDWLDKNPYKKGVNWTSSLECALRLVSWTWALFFIQHSDQLNSALCARILHAIRQHALFISRHLSGYSSANNHLIGEALGLIYAGCYFPEYDEAEEWRKSGFRILFREVLAQVHEDGVAKEQTIHYQRYLFDFVVLALGAAEQARVTPPASVVQRLEKMADFYMALCTRDGAIPHIGDEDGGVALRLVEVEENSCHCLLSTAAALFQRPDFKLHSRQLSEATLWLLGEEAVRRYERLSAHDASQRLRHFDHGGYVIFSQQKPCEQKLVFDCGPLGYGKMAAHGHADALAINLAVHGQNVLIDSGTFLYIGAGAERSYYRGTRAHNTVTIDGKDQSMQLAPFQWGRRATCVLQHIEELPDVGVAQAAHDGYRRLHANHCRRIEQQRDRWMVQDCISGLGYHHIDAYFHLAPCTVVAGTRAMTAEFSTFSVEFECSPASCEQDDILIETAWHSSRFGHREQHPVLRRRISGVLPLTFMTVIRVYE